MSDFTRDPQKALGDLGVRSAAALALAMVALVALSLGGWAWWAFAAVMGVGMLHEWAGLVGASPVRRMLALAALCTGLALAAPAWWGADRFTVAALVGLAILAAVVTNHTRLGLGVVYAGVPVAALLYLRTGPDGFRLALWTIAVVCATDVGAYFAGRSFGGPLLAPRLSPKKTWSGLAGGAAFALVIGAMLAYAGALPWTCLWLGAPLALLAQAGDIYESAMKRRAGVKDSGSLLPGHGGLLDRLDGLVPVAVLVAALAANGNLAG